jgi:GNAT superfamily N-acetyltransferase
MDSASRGVDWIEGRARLAASELSYAKFNADRTTTGDPLATLGSTDTLSFISDASRPTNSYYNRAWCSTANACCESELAALPSTTVAVELVPHALNDSSAIALTEFGLRPSYSLTYLSHSLEQLDTPSAMVDRFDSSQVDTFLDLLELEGAQFPTAIRSEKRRFYCTDTFNCFGVRSEEGSFVAWSTAHIAGDTAFFGNTFVVPEYRGRGYQRQLLSARLLHAKERGVAIVFTDVEPNSQSQTNCERAGFRTVSTNTIWVRTKTN